MTKVISFFLFMAPLILFSNWDGFYYEYTRYYHRYFNIDVTTHSIKSITMTIDNENVITEHFLENGKMYMAENRANNRIEIYEYDSITNISQITILKLGGTSYYKYSYSKNDNIEEYFENDILFAKKTKIKDSIGVIRTCLIECFNGYQNNNTCLISYIYNDKGLIIEKRNIFSEKFSSIKDSFKYDSLGNCIERNLYSCEDIVVKVVYGFSSNKLICEKLSNESSKTLQTIDYEYDNEGKLMRSTTKGYGSYKDYYIIAFEYNAQNLLSSRKTYKKNGKLKSEIVFTYEFY